MPSNETVFFSRFPTRRQQRRTKQCAYSTAPFRLDQLGTYTHQHWGISTVSVEIGWIWIHWSGPEKIPSLVRIVALRPSFVGSSRTLKEPSGDRVSTASWGKTLAE